MDKNGNVMKSKDGVAYEMLAPTYYRANYRVISHPDGMSRAEVASSVDARAGFFGHVWHGDVLSVYTD